MPTDITVLQKLDAKLRMLVPWRLQVDIRALVNEALTAARQPTDEYRRGVEDAADAVGNSAKEYRVHAAKFPINSHRFEEFTARAAAAQEIKGVVRALLPATKPEERK